MIKDFNYYLTGSGWAEASFSNESKKVTFEISYLTDPDPLSELFPGLIRLFKKRSDSEIIVFLDEPGAHALIISKQDSNFIKVEIQLGYGYKTGAKKLLYSDVDTLKNFTSVICLGMERLLERHTLSEYKVMWRKARFPIEFYDDLKNLIGKT